MFHIVTIKDSGVQKRGKKSWFINYWYLLMNLLTLQRWQSQINSLKHWFSCIFCWGKKSDRIDKVTWKKNGVISIYKDN